MTEEQYNLTERMEEEYADYVDELLKADKHMIISMSDKTTFFANMLAYSKERGLPPMQTAALCRTKTPLNDLYLCFMNNNEDYLQRANTAVKVLYQFTREQRNQNQM